MREISDEDADEEGIDFCGLTSATICKDAEPRDAFEAIEDVCEEAVPFNVIGREIIIACILVIANDEILEDVDLASIKGIRDVEFELFG